MEKTNEINFANDVLNKDRVLVEFTAKWCSSSRTIENEVHQLNIESYSVDYETNPSLASKYGIRFIPTLILFENGKAVKSITNLESLRKCIN